MFRKIMVPVDLAHLDVIEPSLQVVADQVSPCLVRGHQEGIGEIFNKLAISTFNAFGIQQFGCEDHHESGVAEGLPAIEQFGQTMSW